MLTMGLLDAAVLLSITGALWLAFPQAVAGWPDLALLVGGMAFMWFVFPLAVFRGRR